MNWKKYLLVLVFTALVLSSASAEPKHNMKLLENSCGVVECSALLQLKTPSRVLISRGNQFGFDFEIEKGAIKSHSTRLGKEIKVAVPQYIEYCHDETVPDENTPMATIQVTVCESIKDWNTPTYKTEIQWLGEMYNQHVEPDVNYFLEIKAQKDPDYFLGEFKVDWVLTFAGHAYKEWAWWNGNWTGKKQIFVPNNIDLNKGDTVVVQVDFTAITTRADLYDVRVVDENLNLEVGRKIEGTSADSDAYVGFFLNNPIYAGQLDVNYIYLYYSYAGASAPTDANAALTKVCNAEEPGDFCQFADPVTRSDVNVLYGVGSMYGTGAGRSRGDTPTLGASYVDFNYSVSFQTGDVTKLTGMSIAAGATNVCTGSIYSGNLTYNDGGFQVVAAAANNTLYGQSIRYVDNSDLCEYTWYDEDGVAIYAASGTTQEGTGTITGVLVYLNDGGGEYAMADNIYIGHPAFAIGLGAEEADNAAPTMTSIDLNAFSAKQNDHIKVVVAGAADGESEALTLLCGTASNPTVDTNNFCTSFSIPSPYTTVSCTGNGAAGDGLQTIYCRLFDLVNYSSEKSDTYTADNTAPVVGAMIFDGFILSYTGGFIDGSGTFFATADANYCEYSLDDSTWTSGTFDGTYCVSPTIVINDKTIYAFNQRAFDGVGNSGTGTAVNYTGKGVLVDPENIEDAELINASWTLLYNTFIGIAFALGTIILIILSMIVIKAFFN